MINHPNGNYGWSGDMLLVKIEKTYIKINKRNKIRYEKL
jgi:hypothetical protein